MQGQSVSLSFSSSDASTAAAVVLHDADGAVRTLLANERLLIDSLTAFVAAAITVTLFSDNDASGDVDAGETIVVLSAAANRFSGGKEGAPAGVGITPSVLASGAGQVDIHGTGRIVVLQIGDVRPSYKETFGGH